MVVLMAAAPPGSQDARGFRLHSSEIQAFLAFQVATWGVTEVVSSVDIKASKNRAWRSLLPSGGFAVGAGFEWTPRGAFLSCTPSTGMYGFDWDGGWTVGALVLLSTFAGLARSFYFPYAEEQFIQGPRLPVHFVPFFFGYRTFLAFQ